MPIYDFDCAACGVTFEAHAPAGETAPCTACGSADVTRRWAAPMPPAKIGLRGVEARRSDATRTVREERRQEGFAKSAERRKQGGPGS